MTRDWVKNLLFEIVIGTVTCVALLNCVGTVEAADLRVDPSSIAVSFAFNQPKDSAYYEAQRTVTIQNIKPNATVSGSISSISGDISITPSPSSFSLLGGASSPVILTIVALPSASEDVHTFPITVGDVSITVTVTIIYYAKIEVSPSSIDFGVIHRTDNPSRTVRMSEQYGYKAVTVNLYRSGNSWVTGPSSIQIPAGESRDVTVQLTPGYPDRNEYSWTFSLSTTASNTEITPRSISIKVYILLPPKLGRLYDEELELKFDKPKGTVSTYTRYIEVGISNIGDETLYFTSTFTAYTSGVSIRIVNPTGSVSGKSSTDLRLQIVAPYDAPEGTYRGRVDIKAGEAGSGSVDITVVLKWPVDFSISPSSIDFGALELKELEYEKREVIITLTELYLYKPVRNLRLSKSGESGNWLKEERDFVEISPGESGNITIRIEPGLEAVPKDYLWLYALSASEIGAKRMEVRAKIVPLDITRMIERFRAYERTPLSTKYPSSQSIIAEGVAMLDVIESSEIGAGDWEKTTVLLKGTLSLLSSLNQGIISSEEENYGKAVESLMAASVSASTVQSNSDLNNKDIAGFARALAAHADTTTREVLMDEAKLLELRGWTIKKAVEYALAMNDLSGLQTDENVLESAVSYQYAAILYGLLDEKEKRLENVYEESVLMDKHDDLVSDATDLRIKAEHLVATSKENDLSRIGGWYLLVNPYTYDMFSARYKTAEQYLKDAAMKYKIAGELLLQTQTQEDLRNLKAERSVILLFFISACIVYSLLFLSAIRQIMGGTMAYLRDMDEREVGDILVR
ncbi:MAG: hypothetical protein EFT35_02130 [Methanophagales archaeon ANME-1-THS]|nr:MAG: hypothetical protein EFT35_02130 [Methanophagales archaeon ANME-1-THS]